MIIDKDNIKIILILLVVCLSLGYAYINSDLNINGTAQVKHANWDIHWANVQVTNGSVSANTPTISNQTTVTYSVTLPTPGSFYEFTVDAVNGGQIDAMIDTIDFKLNNNPITNLPAYLKYSVTYSDGVPLEQNHLLAANTTEKYKVRIEYRTDITESQLPTTNQNLTLEFTVTYRQANEDAQEIEHIEIKYTANLYNNTVAGENKILIGQAIPNSITQYSSTVEALEALRTATGDNSIQFYFKHAIQGGVVTESYIDFIITPAMVTSNPGVKVGTYTLRGLDTYDEENETLCKSEYYNLATDECISPYYESNKQVLQTAFGNSHCIEDSDSFWCSVSGLGANAIIDGGIGVNNSEWACRVNNDGSSICNNDR